jgi:hypothetical protein
MGTPARFTNGVTNVRKVDLLGAMGMPSPLAYHILDEDFTRYVAGDWTITETEAGAGDAAQALQNESFGVLKITNDAADDDACFMQRVGETFKFVAGKHLWFYARFKVSDATQSDFVIGLQITDTAPLDVTDGVFFQKDDGDANLDFHVEKNNTATDKTAIATVVADTYMEVGFHYDGAARVEYYIDGVLKGSAAVTNLVDDEELCVSFGIQNGEAVAKSMSIDRIFVAVER